MDEEKTVELTQEEVARQIQQQVGLFLGQVFFDPRDGRASILLDKDTTDTICSRFPYTVGSIYATIGRDASAAGVAHMLFEKTKGKKQQGPQIVTASSLPANMPPPPKGRRGKGRG